MFKQIGSVRLVKTVAAALALLTSSLAGAQDKYWETDYPYSKDIFSVWSTVSEKYMVQISEYATICDGLTGLTDFESQPQNFSSWYGWNCAINSQANELILTPQTANNICGALLDFSAWDGDKPSSKIITLAGLNRAGYIVDMQPTASGISNGAISGEVFVPAQTGLTSLEFVVNCIDAHGHISNSAVNQVITVTDFDQWVPFDFDYGTDIDFSNETIYDQYSEYFHQLKFRSNGSSSVTKVPIDFAHISGLEIVIPSNSGTEAIRFRNMSIGRGGDVRSYRRDDFSPLANHKYWDETCFTGWDAIAQDYLVGYSADSALACTGIKGLTDFASREGSRELLSVYGGYDFDTQTDNISRTDSSIKWTIPITKTNYLNWSYASMEFYGWEKGKSPQEVDFSNSKMTSFVVDMRDAMQVSGSVNISGSLDTIRTNAKLTCGVIDAHGHYLDFNNQDFSQHFSEFNTWIDFSFSFDSLLNKCTGSLYNNRFHNVVNPIYYLSTGSTYPYNENLAPIDWEHIVGVFFSVDLGLNVTQKQTVELKDIIIGNPETAINLHSKYLNQRPLLHLPKTTVYLADAVEGKHLLGESFKYTGEELLPLQLRIESLTPGYTFSLEGDTAVTISSSDNCIATGKAALIFSNKIHQYSDTLFLVLTNPDFTPSLFTAVPTQESISLGVFKSIDLNDYFTNPCTGNYTATVRQGKHIALTVDALLQVKITTIDASWMGSETGYIDLMYDGQIVHTFSIDFEQIHPTTTLGETLALVSIAPKHIEVAPNQMVSLQASAKGANTISWATPEAVRTGSAIAPKVSYSVPGDYFAVVTVSNETDTIRDTVKISIIGIVAASRSVCQGSSMELSASVAGTYLWSTGATTQSISVTPTVDTDYILTITKSGEKYIDSLNVHVIKPFAEELAIATVSSDNKSAVLAWERSAGKDIAKYKVLREGNKDDIYDTIATLPFDSVSIYIDTTADVSKTTYKYTIITENTCGVRSARSTIHETVHLRITPDIYGKASLVWNQYLPKDIYQSVGVYRVESGDLVLLDSLAGSKTTYTDNMYKPGNEYRVAIFLNDSVAPSRLKSDLGPFSQSMSNIAEAISLSSLEHRNTALYVFPNPSASQFNIAVTHRQPVPYSVAVTDMAGIQVYAKDFARAAKDLVVIPQLPAGTYTLTVTTPQGTISETLVAQ